MHKAVIATVALLASGTGQAQTAEQLVNCIQSLSRPGPSTMGMR